MRPGLAVAEARKHLARPEIGRVEARTAARRRLREARRFGAQPAERLRVGAGRELVRVPAHRSAQEGLERGAELDAVCVRADQRGRGAASFDELGQRCARFRSGPWGIVEQEERVLLELGSVLGHGGERLDLDLRVEGARGCSSSVGPPVLAEALTGSATIAIESELVSCETGARSSCAIASRPPRSAASSALPATSSDTTWGPARGVRGACASGDFGSGLLLALGLSDGSTPEPSRGIACTLRPVAASGVVHATSTLSCARACSALVIAQSCTGVASSGTGTHAAGLPSGTASPARSLKTTTRLS